MRNLIARDPSDAALLEACLPELVPFGTTGSLLLLRGTEDTVAARAYWESLGLFEDP